MDYCSEVTKSFIFTDALLHSAILEQMEAESDLIRACLEGLDILTEADENDTAQAKTRSVWEKIKEFFKQLFSIFTDKTKQLFATNKKWMDANFNKLDKIDYSKVSIEMIPYWNVDLNKAKSEILSISKTFANLGKTEENLKKYSDFNTLKNEVLKNYLDENGDLTNGLKNFYRVGNAKGPLKAETVSGRRLAELVKEMKAFCFTYDKNVLPMLNSCRASIEQEIQRIEAATKTVTEGFCLVENAYYRDTDLKYIPGYQVLFEAEQSANNQQQNQNNQQQTNQQQSTNPRQVSVKVSGNVNKGQQTTQNNQGQNQDDNKYKNYNALQLKFLNNIAKVSETNISACMTAMEDRFAAYMVAMKQLVAQAGKGVDNAPTTGNKKEDEERNTEGIVTNTAQRLKAAREELRK